MTPFAAAREAPAEVTMRTSPVKIILGAAVLGLTVTAGTAQAEELCRVSVPFHFTVNGHTLPEGQYLVRSDDQDPSIVTIEGITNTASAVVSTVPDYRPSSTAAKPGLTFLRYGADYQLSQIWETGQYGRDVVAR
jgi:hypothetical protein